MKRRKPQVAKTLKAEPGSPAPPARVSGDVEIPAILFEGDEPEPAPVVERDPANSIPPNATSTWVAAAEPGELPEAYGTGRLLVLARDPHCLYAHWDLTSAHLKQNEALSTDGHLVVRCHSDELSGPLAAEVRAQASVRHCFLSVPAAGTQYVVELGYYGAERRWVQIAVSGPATTPHETASEDRTFELAIAPPWPQGPASTPTAAGPTIPPRVSWIPALGVGSGALGHEQTPGKSGPPEPTLGEWSEVQERALAELMGPVPEALDALSSMEFC